MENSQTTLWYAPLEKREISSKLKVDFNKKIVTVTGEDKLRLIAVLYQELEFEHVKAEPICSSFPYCFAKLGLILRFCICPTYLLSLRSMIG